MFFQEYGLLDEGSIAKSVKYSNVVINLVGQDYHSRYPSDLDCEFERVSLRVYASPLFGGLCRHYTLKDVNVDGARNVARAAAAAGAQRLIHVSALGADVNSPSEFMRTKV